MITSSSNPKIKELRQLQKKAALRQEKGVFLVEGFRMVQEAPKERISAVYAARRFEKEQADWLARWGVSYELVEDRVFDSVSDTKSPQGILCVVKRKEWSLQDLLADSVGTAQDANHSSGSKKGIGTASRSGKTKRKKAPFFLIVEDLQDPGNLGTIFRTGEAAGISGIIMSRKTVDIYNPKTVRSTMGSIYRVPFLYADSLAEAVSALKAADICVYAAHLKGEKLYNEVSYETGTAFLIGNEGKGLSEETAALADDYLKIPMEGKVESLNAASASAVLMYEVHRQRSL